jgi:hypothetical protein
MIRIYAGRQMKIVQRSTAVRWQVKVKAVSVLFVTEHHAIKAYWGVKV